eukprot:GHVU01159645.1.p1 GENE.GHVU01159645.1~~GHVU01159645.1.p1  ORF type:complete len:387 (-),score=83.45 GHVU01159645.1:3-1163(-)
MSGADNAVGGVGGDAAPDLCKELSGTLWSAQRFESLFHDTVLKVVRRSSRGAAGAPSGHLGFPSSPPPSGSGPHASAGGGRGGGATLLEHTIGESAEQEHLLSQRYPRGVHSLDLELWSELAPWTDIFASPLHTGTPREEFNDLRILDLLAAHPGCLVLLDFLGIPAPQPSAAPADAPGSANQQDGAPTTGGGGVSLTRSSLSTLPNIGALLEVIEQTSRRLAVHQSEAMGLLAEATGSVNVGESGPNVEAWIAVAERVFNRELLYQAWCLRELVQDIYPSDDLGVGAPALVGPVALAFFVQLGQRRFVANTIHAIQELVVLSTSVRTSAYDNPQHCHSLLSVLVEVLFVFATRLRLCPADILSLAAMVPEAFDSKNQPVSESVSQ